MLAAGIHFGIDRIFAAGEGIAYIVGITVNILDHTSVNIHRNVLRPEVVVLPEGLSGVALQGNIRIEVNDTDGQGCQSLLAFIIRR